VVTAEVPELLVSQIRREGAKGYRQIASGVQVFCGAHKALDRLNVNAPENPLRIWQPIAKRTQALVVRPERRRSDAIPGQWLVCHKPVDRVDERTVGPLHSCVPSRSCEGASG